MAKTFEEWFIEKYLKKRPPIDEDGDPEYYYLKKITKEAWEASRQNMTTKDI